MDTPVVHVDHSRWRLDDGAEGTGGASFHEVEDTAHTFVSSGLDVNVRLRCSCHAETATTANQILKLQYNHEGGGPVDVTTISSVARVSTTANYTDADDTTDWSDGLTYVGSGSFFTNNDCCDDGDGSAGSNNTDVPAQDYWAVEFCFQLLEADLANGETVTFSVVAGVTGVEPTTTITATANIEISAPTGPSIPVVMSSYRRHHERGR